MPNPIINRRLIRPVVGVSGPPLNPLITAWAAQVVTNGGAAPSAATKTALSNFADGLTNDALDLLMIHWNAIVPDNLTAALTPQLQGPGTRAMWLNQSSVFIPADLSVNGLTGDAATKFVATGVKPTDFPSISNAGLVTYAYTASATGISTGVANTGQSWHELAAKFSDNNTYDRNSGIGTLIQVASPGNGYYSSQRTGSTTHNLYFASSVSAHASKGSESADVTGVPLCPNEFVAWAFSLNGNLVVSNFAADTISFWGICQGLTSAQDALLFNRIQTLRQALGGGFR